VLAAVAVEQVATQLHPSMREPLMAAHAEAVRVVAALLTPTDALRACLGDADPFVRAVAVYGLAQRGVVDPEVLGRLSHDEHALVGETATALSQRQATRADAGDDLRPMITIEKLIALRCVPVFAALGPDDLEEMARASEERAYAPGEALCVEGELGDEVFVLLRGVVNVVRGPKSEGELLHTESAGSVIGEMAVLEAAPRSASVFAAAGGAYTLRLAGSAFRRVLGVNPAVAEGIIRALARRLRITGQVPITS
jgi:hypothetical protein